MMKQHITTFILATIFVSHFVRGQDTEVFFGSALNPAPGFEGLFFADQFGIAFSSENPALIAVGFFQIEPLGLTYQEIVSDFTLVGSVNYDGQGVENEGFNRSSIIITEDYTENRPFTLVVGGINDWAQRLSDSVSSFSLYTDSSYEFSAPSIPRSDSDFRTTIQPDIVIAGTLEEDQTGRGFVLRTEEVRPIPETSSIHLIALGLVGMSLRRRRA